MTWPAIGMCMKHINHGLRPLMPALEHPSLLLKSMMPTKLVIWNEWCLQHRPENPGTILGRENEIESNTENTEKTFGVESNELN